MEQRALHRFILALLACLAWPIAGNALTCPPGEREEAGRCVPASGAPRFEKRIAPESDNSGKKTAPKFETFEKKTGSGSAPRIAPNVETKSQQPPPRIPSEADIEKSSAAPATGAGNRREASSERQLVPVRAYLKGAEIPPPSIGAYGIVAFRARPTSASRSRLLMTCAAFVTAIPPQKSVPGSVHVGDEMLTIWPLDEPSSPNAARDDCNFAIDHYDLYAADSAIADAARQGAEFGAEGPFLIGWSPSNSRGVPDKLVLVVDMSLYDSQDSFDQAFQFWKEKIVEDPSLWRSGFSIETVRLAVRDFADHYGDTILKAAVSVWKK
jgi:hypothetical protein